MAPGTAPYIPENQGFERVIGGRHHPGPPGGYFAPFAQIDTIPDAKPGEHVDDILAREAVRYIQDNKGKPFLLNLWFHSVHGPFQAKQDLVQAAQGRIPAAGSPHAQNSPTMAAMVETMDDNLGKVLDAVEAAGIADNTVIIFNSDNGGNTYSHVDGTVPTTNFPLRAGKGCIYEGGQRVPLIVSWPGHIKAGTTSEAVVSSVDFFPTLLQIAGVKLPSDIVQDGESILPVLTGQGQLHRDAIFCHFAHFTPATGNYPATSVRQGDWKLIRFYGANRDRTDRLELYDLSKDIGERNDLAAAHPERVKELNQRIEGFLKSSEALIPHANPQYIARKPGWVHAGETVPEDQVLQIPGDRSSVYSIETEDFHPVMNRDVEVRLKLSSQGPVSGVVSWTVRGAQEGKGTAVRSVEFKSEAGNDEVVITAPLAQMLASLKIDFAPGADPVSVKEIEISLPENPIKKWTFSQSTK